MLAEDFRKCIPFSMFCDPLEPSSIENDTHCTKNLLSKEDNSVNVSLHSEVIINIYCSEKSSRTKYQHLFNVLS